MHRILLFSVLLLQLPRMLAADLTIYHLPFPEDMVTHRINCVTSSSDGMMWIGTPAGLCRYDGYEFVKWQSDPNSAASLLSNYVMDIVEDPLHKLWIRTDMGFSCFDLSTEKFYTDIPALFKGLGIPDYPERIVSDQDGNLWFYVNGDKAALYLKKRDDKQASLIADKSSAIGRNDISGIDISGRYLVLVSRMGEIILYDRCQGTMSGIYDDISKNVSDEAEFSVYADNEDLLWIWNGKGIWLFDINKRRLLPSDIIPAGLDGIIDAVMEDSNGRIWVAQNHRGIMILEKDALTKTLKVSDHVIPALAAQTITSLCQTKDNTIWIGTYKHGLYTYNQSLVKFDHYEMADVNVVHPHGGDKAWIGTDARGLWEWDIFGRTARKVSDSVGEGEHCAIVSIEDDGKGGCFIGTYGNGLMHYSNGQWEHMRTHQGLASLHIWALLRDGDNGLWIGTLGAGLQFMDLNTHNLTTYDTSNSALGNNYISSMAKDRTGNLYISTDDGIAILNTTSRTFEYLKGDKFSNGHVNQLIVDNRGLIWIATRGGLDVYNPIDKSIRNVNLGLASVPDVLGVVEDSDCNIWVSVGSLLCNVIVRDMSNDDYSVHVFNDYDGLTPGDFNQRSLSIIGNGILAAGGLYGISFASPRDIIYDVYDGKVVFSALALNGQKVIPGEMYDGNVIISNAMCTSPTVNIYDAKGNTYTVYFSTDNFMVPLKTQYFYRLGGEEAEWVKCPAGVNFVSFANLSPGKYDLFVKAVNSDGLPLSSPAQISIVVHPPFWASHWAFCIYALSLLALIALVVWFIKLHEKRRFIKAQYQQELQRQQRLNQMKLKFFTNISHELRTPLTLILTPIEDMIKHNDGNIDKARLDMIYRNAHQLLGLVDQIMDFRKCEINELQFIHTIADIVDICDKNILKFKPLAESKSISLGLDRPQNKIMSMIDVDKTDKIISNLLSNAIKFTPNGGSVILRVETLNKMIVIKVIDTGIGISDKDKAHIFERFYQADTNADNSIAGTGIGLNMVWEYVKACNGSVEVSDNPSGKGSVFTVSLPLLCSSSSKRALTSADSGLQSILIVDDNPDILSFLDDHLSNQYHVVKAINGVVAMDILKNEHIDLIISDIMMPEMDGIELCRYIKSDASLNSIPLILLTAKNDMSSKLEGLTLGADDYVTKPFNMEELKLRIKNQLKLSNNGIKRMLLEPVPSNIEITSADEIFIEKAVKYVEDNMERINLSVEELSSALCVSRAKLYKKILAITGKTPLEFIRILRLKRAAQLLRESQMNVSEVAFSTGFGTPKYFSRYFRDEFGILPSQYQKSYKSVQD